MSETNNHPPTVFISYSHDSKDHKAWVAKLGTRLRENGVDILLDQWDTEPGDDLPKFMEKGISASDRVLMICTEAYTRKVDDGKGGAGYEGMIVTAELVSNQGINKFVPVLRQTSSSRIKPICLNTKKHVDLSDGMNFEDEFQELLATLHKVTSAKKPPLGKSPLSETDFRSEAIKTQDRILLLDFSKELEDPIASYATARSIISTQDFANWRRLIQAVQKGSISRLQKWKDQRNDAIPPFDPKEPILFVQAVAEGIQSYYPLLACLLAAAESGDAKYAGQLSWVDDVARASGWKRDGYVFYTQLPRTALFLLHSIVGGMFMHSRQADLAFRLATTPLANSFRSSETRPLYRSTDVTGWTDSLEHTCTVGWLFLTNVENSCPWLEQIFGSKEELTVSKSAYYMLLNFLEACVSTKMDISNLANASLEVPICFSTAPSDILQAAYKLLLDQRETLQTIMKQNGIGKETLETIWPDWMKANYRWLGSVYHFSLRFNRLPQEKLPQDLFQNPYELKA